MRSVTDGRSVVRPLAVLAALTSIAFLLVVGPALATPIWNLDIHHSQTNFPPGGRPVTPTVTTETQGSPTADEVQEIVVGASAGQFRLGFGPDTTPDLPYDATAAQVQAALRALPSIGSPNVTVSSLTTVASDYFSSYDVTFTGALADTDVALLEGTSGAAPLALGPEYWFDLENVGDTASSGTVTLTINLPTGITRNSVRTGNLLPPFAWSCPGSPGDSTVTCTTNTPIPRHTASHSLILLVNVKSTLEEGQLRTAKATVTGGGAAPSPTVLEPARISSTPAGFGIVPESFLPEFFRSDGLTAVRGAGSHPDLFPVPFDFTTVDHPEVPNPFQKAESGSIRDLTVDLPPGFIGNPTAVGECSAADLPLDACPPSSQVGVAYVKTPAIVSTHGPTRSFDNYVIPVFNMSHPRGAVSDLGFAILANPVHVRVSLDPSNHYAIHSVVSAINETVAAFNQRLTLWGVPADHSHDSQRCPLTNSELIETNKDCSTDATSRPFLTAPSQCEADNTFRLHHYDSWQEPGVYGEEIDYTLPGKFTGCDKPRFDPDVSVHPTGTQANTPTGLEVHVKVPQNENPNALATPPVRSTVVTLPEGMSFSPSFADGLQSCTMAQFGISPLGVPDAEPVNCPDASRIGEVSLSTPLLPKPAEGSMYLAAQGANPFHSTFALYLVLHDTEERGALIKIPGKIEVDEQTGQITTIFDETPQFPFEDLTLKFRSGPRAPLVNPPSCGPHTIAVTLTSWAQPDVPLDASNTYDITEGPNGSPCPPDSAHRPFAPRFSGGTLNPVAGSYSTFLFRLSREDQEQELSQVTTVLPPGLLAKVAGIPFCSDQAIASISTELGAGAGESANPACPPASQIGTVSAGLGAGPGPNYFPGKVYLAGPYKGAPLSLAIVAPGLAGPFDLGNVLVRVALRVDPDTSRVTAVSDPFPTILHGVILRVRDVRLRLDRPETTLNPTSCDPLSLNAAITGVGGDLLSTADDSLFNTEDRFQVGDCGRLPFKPKIAFTLTGGMRRAEDPAFYSRLTARPGDANIGKVVVALPKTEFLDNAHINAPCTRVQYREGAVEGERCSAGSIIGHAKAVTPLLDQPVEGPVILRSNPERTLPDLVADLQGQISANLVGHIDSSNGGIRTTFETVPDVPVTEFVLTMKGGNKGLLENAPPAGIKSLCETKNRVDIKFTAQNNKFEHLRPLLKAASCGHKKHKRHHSRHYRGH
jgi:hypothetical protein